MNSDTNGKEPKLTSDNVLQQAVQYSGSAANQDDFDTLMATSNSPTYGQSNSPRQDD